LNPTDGLLRRLNPLLLPARAAPRHPPSPVATADKAPVLFRRLDALLWLSLSIEHRFQERPRIRTLLPHDLLRRARGHDLAAAVAAFGAEVDDPVGRLDDFEIVLDDHHGVAGVDQLVQHFEELCHVVEVQAGGGLI
jgi:hypothetical protein